MVRLRGLGECLLDVGTTTLTPEADTLFGVLLYLASNAGAEVPRDRLTGLFWPGREYAAAHHCLRQTLYKLRHYGARITNTRDGIVLEPARVEADQAAIYVEDEIVQHGHLARIAVFLPGYAPRHSDAFADWVDAERSRVHARVRRTLLKQLVVARSKGRYAIVDALARKCLELDPLNEEATLALAESTALGGNKVEAVRMLDRYQEEIGPGQPALKVPVNVLRRRISEGVPEPTERYQEAAFVGRDDIIERLTTALRAARNGKAGAVLLRGEAGVGKSRIVTEFAKLAIIQGARVEQLRCQPGDENLPLSAFVRLVPKLLQLPGALGADPDSLACLRKLTIHETVKEPQAVDPRESGYRYARVRASLHDVIDSVTSETTLVVVLDDAHRLDDVSVGLLTELLERNALKPFACVFALRSDEAARAFEAPLQRRASTVITLEPLETEESSALLASLAERRGKSLGHEHVAWCLDLASGNPFFLHELANHCFDQPGSTMIPQSLQRLLSSRISHLTRNGVRVLQAVAILRNHCTVRRLEEMLGLMPHQLLDAFAELESTGAIVHDSGSVRPRHDLLSEEALRQLSGIERVLLHRRAASLLEKEIESTSSVSLLWACADHWEHAEETRRAVTLARTRGEYLVRIGLPNEAIELLTRAYARAESEVERLACLDSLSKTHMMASRWSDVLRFISEKETLLRSLGRALPTHGTDEHMVMLSRWRCDPHRRNDIASIRECVMAVDADAQHRLDMAVLGLVIADNSFDSAIAREIYNASQRLSFSSLSERIAKTKLELIYQCSFGDLELAELAAQDLILLSRQSDQTHLLPLALRWASAALRRLGRFDEAAAMLNESWEIAERLAQRWDMVAAVENMSQLAHVRGDETAALAFSRRHAELCEPPVPELERAGALHDCARAALLQDDTRLAAALLGDARAITANPALLRARIQMISVRIHAALTGAAGPLDPTMVDDLLNLHAVLRGAGEQDYQTAVLTASLSALGRREEAQLVWSRYKADHRRERHAVPAAIVRTVTRAGVRDVPEATDVAGNRAGG
jgi:DNA-binding SARP family transcriptional activator/tetratricopeptide (TPR) repeat protein